MVAKKIVVCLSCGVLITAVALWNTMERAKFQTKPQTIETPATKKVAQVPKATEPKYNLYSNTLYELPFSAIMEISKLTPSLQKKIDNLLETSQGFYFFNKQENNIFIILQNPISENNTYPRHELEFVNISLNPNEEYKTTITRIGYCGEENEILNAIDTADDKQNVWNFDKTTEPYKPLRHKKYNEKGKLLFTEKWDFSENSEIKYQIKDSKGKILSVLKETSDNDSNFRKEHVFYDENGNTTKSFTINFDGANITRFTYYNANDLHNSGTIINEYSDGIKIGEKIYNQDYQLINSYVMEYQDEERKSLKQFDSQDNEVRKISS